MTAAGVTIVVLNWNQKDETIACLRSLAAADLGGAAVVVVDNGSRDGSVDALRAEFPSVRILALPENRGFAGGCNAGMRAALEAGAEGILLLNNDTRVARDFLLPLLDAMHSSPGAGAVSSAAFRLDRPTMLDVAYSEVRFNRRHVVQILGVNALPGEGFDRRAEVGVVNACSLLLKAEALRTVGLFDEAYFAYHEDVDWCLRARQAGYQLFYEPYSRVLHRGSRSTGVLHERPADEPDLALGADLPNAGPLPWNPVRTYLGIRNTVRLLRRYATRKQQLAFARACARELPLEFTALLMNAPGWMKLGRWSWGRFAHAFFVDRHPVLRTPASGRLDRLRRAVALVVLPVVDTLWALPREIARARRRGRFIEFAEYLRGLRDGILDRPLPLERLGLR